jgi:hypothetical protein
VTPTERRSPPAHRRDGSRARALVLGVALALGGCQSIRLYAKDLLDPRASAAVSVPVRLSIGLFVLPPVLAWLPLSIAPLLVFHDEPAVWFALAPGLAIGGPFVLLFGTPGYLLTDRPPPETTAAPVTSAGEGQAPVASSSPSAR